MSNSIKVFIDGPTEIEINLAKEKNADGFTFNPTLFKKLGVKDYLSHCRKIIELAGNVPISLEVIGDTENEIIHQAEKLSHLSKNVFVKIPITYTSGQSTVRAMEKLIDQKINANITAVFTRAQIETILPTIRDTNTIISVFAGRLYDIGIDAAAEVRDMATYVHAESSCQILWASSRMHYDYITSAKSNCDIITMSFSMFSKLGLIGKDPEEYSIETVRMFYDDATSSGFVI